MQFISHPTKALNGTITVPGDKSISHRALLLSGIAKGTSTIKGLLLGEDCLATLNAMRAMGVMITPMGEDECVVQGVGLHGLQKPSAALDCGNAGTGMRLLAGLLAGQTFATTLTGDASLTKRPMLRVAKPLELMGAQLQLSVNNTAPIHLPGGHLLHGIDYVLPMPSAQVKSCVLFAGLYADGKTRVIEPIKTRDHTERMLRAFGYPLEMCDDVITITGGYQSEGRLIEIPADISSAAFFMVAASIIPGSDITLLNVGINPTRTGVIEILHLMGADIELQNQRVLGEEPVADIRVRAAALTGIDIPAALIPAAIDEFPVLFIAAACADGVTCLRGAKELRVKESDRIAAMAEGLAAVGVLHQTFDDGIQITGSTIRAGTVNSHRDHRIAMAFAIAGAVADGPVHILDCDQVATSFPGFADLANQLGCRVSI